MPFQHVIRSTWWIAVWLYFLIFLLSFYFPKYRSIAERVGRSLPAISAQWQEVAAALDCVWCVRSSALPADGGATSAVALWLHVPENSVLSETPVTHTCKTLRDRKKEQRFKDGRRSQGLLPPQSCVHIRGIVLLFLNSVDFLENLPPLCCSRTMSAYTAWSSDIECCTAVAQDAAGLKYDWIKRWLFAL